MSMTIALVDLVAQHRDLLPELREATERVLASGRYILGPEVATFERDVAAWLGVEHAIGVSSGSDALVMGLQATGIGRGDEVVTTPLSFFATVEAILRVGATPRFADVDPTTLNLDPGTAADAITARTRALLPAHLFGVPAAVEDFHALAQARGLALVDDAAQAFGARLFATRAPAPRSVAAFSFFPTKPLGGFGDGGLVVTRDEHLAERCRELRVHGATRPHHHVYVGGNYRLDALQAALLRVSLPHASRWRERRAELEARYREQLADVAEIALSPPPSGSAHSHFTLRVLDGRRDPLAAHLAEAGIETGIYYPQPLYRQPALTPLLAETPECPVAERATMEVLSLPLSAGLKEADLDYVATKVRAYFGYHCA